VVNRVIITPLYYTYVGYGWRMPALGCMM